MLGAADSRTPLTRFVASRARRDVDDGEPQDIGTRSVPLYRAARFVDVVGATLALAVFLPVMAVIAVLVATTSPGPALFRQVRLGRDGRLFVMYKFRTMFVHCDDRMHRDYVGKLLTHPEESAVGPDGLYKLAGDPRVTPVGRWLRKSSLDELPQLFNVLLGAMSLVGPRPVLPWEAALFGPKYADRFLVRPGMTGLWQTSGRNRLTMTQALELDLQYVKDKSLALDLRIMIRTIPEILGARRAR